MDKAVNLLTVDCEEWFVAEALASYHSRDEWDRLTSTVVKSQGTDLVKYFSTQTLPVAFNSGSSLDEMEKQLERKMTDKKIKVKLLMEIPVEKKHGIQKGMELELTFGQILIDPGKPDEKPYWVEGWWWLDSPHEPVKLLVHEYQTI